MKKNFIAHSKNVTLLFSMLMALVINLSVFFLYPITNTVAAGNLYGYVKDWSGSGMGSVTVNCAGPDLDQNVTTSSDGLYSCGEVGNGTYTITPSMSGVAFNPSDRQVTVSASAVQVRDFFLYYRVDAQSSSVEPADQNNWSTSVVANSTAATKISGYIFDADTKASIPGLDVELTSNNATVTPRTTTTTSTGYYEFVFTSQSDVYSSNTDLYLKGQIDVINNAVYKTDYSVSYTNSGNYLDTSNQEVHELVYIYKDRTVWNDSSLHQNYVLIPPFQVPLPQRLDSAKTPLLLVHGMNGVAGYWEGIRKLLLSSPYAYQVWEVYYPNNGPVVEGAAAVKDAIDTLLQNYDASHQLVDLVAHSMGGPVTLAYIQGLARYPYSAPPVQYVPRVRKLLQLSPADHGSVHASRLLGDALSGGSSCATWINDNFLHDDPYAPADQDLNPGSLFMQELYDSINTSGLAVAPSDFLVVTGTNPAILPTIQTLLGFNNCQPGKGQNDAFVSASSASLLDYSIPLGMIYRDHSETRGTKAITLQNQTDYPQTPAQAQPLVNVVGNFFSGNMAVVRNNLDLYIDPVNHPHDPGQYIIYQQGTQVSGPLGADQWNDGRSNTSFNAGSLWIRAFDTQGNLITQDVWMTDGVLYYKLYLSNGDLWYIDSRGVVDKNGNPVSRAENDWGDIAPAGSFSKTYRVFVHTPTADIPLGYATINPVITNYIELDELYRVYLPLILR